MTKEEKILFLSNKVKELNMITSELESMFPEKSFKLDGILVGNIVEILCSEAYGIKLYKQSEKAHDGEVNGKKVQIKGTQGNNYIIIKEQPDFLLVVHLDTETGEIKEIYNGPGDLVWQYCSYIPNMNHYKLSINNLLKADLSIKNEDRIPAIVPIEKYNRPTIATPIIQKSINKKTKPGKTTVTGYINRNNQKNLGCLNKPRNHYNQLAYLLHCNICGFEYEANGCDIAIRKCPNCQ